eukprot:COSAG01_NODE_567_length_15336_cov_341.292689_9_plen_158_part_01
MRGLHLESSNLCHGGPPPRDLMTRDAAPPPPPPPPSYPSAKKCRWFTVAAPIVFSGAQPVRSCEGGGEADMAGAACTGGRRRDHRAVAAGRGVRRGLARRRARRLRLCGLPIARAPGAGRSAEQVTTQATTAAQPTPAHFPVHVRVEIMGSIIMRTD